MTQNEELVLTGATFLAALGNPLTALKNFFSGSVTLYRSAGSAELKQLMSTGLFKAGPNALEGKFFATSAEDAVKWGNAMDGSGNLSVVGTEFKKGIPSSFQHWEKLDNIGPA